MALSCAVQEIRVFADEDPASHENRPKPTKTDQLRIADHGSRVTNPGDTMSRRTRTKRRLCARKAHQRFRARDSGSSYINTPDETNPTRRERRVTSRRPVGRGDVFVDLDVRRGRDEVLDALVGQLAQPREQRVERLGL